MSEASDVTEAGLATLAAPRSRARAAIIMALKVALAVGLVAVFLLTGRIDPGKLAESMRRVVGSPGTLAFALLAVGANMSLAAVRWWILVRGEGVVMPFFATCRISLIGNFFNTFMPGAIGGDPFKVYYVAAFAPPGRRVEAGATVLVDRAVGLLALVLAIVLAEALLPLLGWRDAAFDGISARLTERVGPYAMPLLALALVGSIGLALLMNPAVRRTPALQAIVDRVPGARVFWRVVKSVLHAATRPWTALLALLCACVGHAFTISLFVMISRSLGDTMDVQRFLLIVPVGLIVHVVPLTPNGIGVGEAAFAWLFEAAGSQGSIGFTACAVWHVVTLLYNAAGGVVYAMERRASPAA